MWYSYHALPLMRSLLDRETRKPLTMRRWSLSLQSLFQTQCRLNDVWALLEQRQMEKYQQAIDYNGLKQDFCWVFFANL